MKKKTICLIVRRNLTSVFVEIQPDSDTLDSLKLKLSAMINKPVEEFKLIDPALDETPIELTTLSDFSQIFMVFKDPNSGIWEPPAFVPYPQPPPAPSNA